MFSRVFDHISTKYAIIIYFIELQMGFVSNEMTKIRTDGAMSV